MLQVPGVLRIWLF